jgi:hypothetical protein
VTVDEIITQNNNDLGHINPRDVQRMDSTAHMKELSAVGARLGEHVAAGHFEGF